jgi:hypothetical protein
MEGKSSFPLNCPFQAVGQLAQHMVPFILPPDRRERSNDIKFLKIVNDSFLNTLQGIVHIDAVLLSSPSTTLLCSDAAETTQRA